MARLVLLGPTNSSGAEVARYASDPYGNPPLSLDLASARFVSVDPAAQSAGDPVRTGGYSCCSGDPGLTSPWSLSARSFFIMTIPMTDATCARRCDPQRQQQRAA